MTSAVNIDKFDAGQSEPYPWILHPAIDLLLACGGLFLIFVILCMIFPATFAPGSQIGSAIVLFSLITLSMPHGIATYLRVYDSKLTKKSVGNKVTIIALVCAAAGYATMFSDLAFSLFAHVAWFFGIQHLFAQSYGVALIYCFKRKYYFNKLEQKIFNFAAVQMPSICCTASVFASPDSKLFYRSLGAPWVPSWTPDVTQALMCLTIVAFVAICVKKWLKEGKAFPLPSAMTIGVSYLYQGFILQQPILAAIAITPGFHLTQYVVVTTSCHLKECGLPENVPLSKIYRMLWKPVALKYFAFLVGAGFITSIVIIPKVWGLNKVVGVNIQDAVVAVWLAMNVHHYFTDAVIWKQKDPAMRKLLVS